MIAVGRPGPERAQIEVYRTRDGGLSWQRAELPTRERWEAFTLRMAFHSPQVGWILNGDGRTLYATADGGRTWTALPLAVSVRGAHLRFTSPQNGWAVLPGQPGRGGRDATPGRLFRTTNAGHSWQELPPIRLQAP